VNETAWRKKLILVAVIVMIGNSGLSETKGVKAQGASACNQVLIEYGQPSIYDYYSDEKANILDYTSCLFNPPISSQELSLTWSQCGEKPYGSADSLDCLIDFTRATWGFSCSTPGQVKDCVLSGCPSGADNPCNGIAAPAGLTPVWQCKCGYPILIPDPENWVYPVSLVSTYKDASSKCSMENPEKFLGIPTIDAVKLTHNDCYMEAIYDMGGMIVNNPGCEINFWSAIPTGSAPSEPEYRVSDTLSSWPDTSFAMLDEWAAGTTYGSSTSFLKKKDSIDKWDQGKSWRYIKMLYAGYSSSTGYWAGMAIPKNCFTASASNIYLPIIVNNY